MTRAELAASVVEGLIDPEDYPAVREAIEAGEGEIVAGRAEFVDQLGEEL